MAFSATARNSLVSEMNITPLVDVMLVLLIIFMVSAPLMTRTVSASLPQASSTDSPIKPPMLQLIVADDGSYRLDGRLFTPAELWQRLDDSVAADPRTVLRINASSGAEYQNLVTALAGARKSGVADIAMQP